MMGVLDDSAIFVAVIQQGGFRHAAKHLAVSTGLISRRIQQLESDLGVTLIKRTTRQLHLTPEGELFWQHALRIQQELDAARCLIQSKAKRPKGIIRITAPPYFGRQFLTPILMDFVNDFEDIQIDLVLSNEQLDPIKSQLDLVIRGAGYVDDALLRDSSLRMKLLTKEKIRLYISQHYLLKHSEPMTVDELEEQAVVHYSENKRLDNQEKWSYSFNGKSNSVPIKIKLNTNDIASALTACIDGHGIGKFTDLNALSAIQQGKIRPILTQYDWGDYNLYVVYPDQQALPKRTRLLLEFITAHVQFVTDKKV